MDLDARELEEPSSVDVEDALIDNQSSGDSCSGATDFGSFRIKSRKCPTKPG